MTKNVLSHALTGCAAALLGAGAVHIADARTPDRLVAGRVSDARDQSAGAQAATQTVLFETTMEDVLGRAVTIREFERAPGTASAPHRHPGSHTFGYVLEGRYEVQVDDGPVRSLGRGEVFYERPGALHAVSRNASTTEVVRYLVLTISDPTLPATVPE